MTTSASDRTYGEFLQHVHAQDVAWYLTMKEWLDDAPTVNTLEEALEPMLKPISEAPEGLGNNVEGLREIIKGTLANMQDTLLLLNLTERYSVHHAGCLHTYTQDSPNPQWFKYMSRHLNDKATRSNGDKISDELASCRNFIKFFIVALEALPPEYIHRDVCWRGVNWVFPDPTFPARDKYFYPGRRSFFFTMRSFSTSKEVATRFSGTGLRTLFQMEPGCYAYKIDKFSQFPNEQEVVFPLLDEIEFLTMEPRITVAAEHVKVPTSSSHTGEPDLVSMKQHIRQPNPAKAQEVERLQAKIGKDFSALAYFFRNGSLKPSRQQTRAENSAKLIVQARDAIVGAVAEMVRGRIVLILVGATGSGKSTLANWLVGNSLTIKRERPDDAPTRVGARRSTRFAQRLAAAGTPQIHVDKSSVDVDFPVGMDNTKSMTFLPKGVKVSHDGMEDVIVVDFPGFLDSTNTECRIAIDLAFRDLVNMAGRAYVLGLADIASVAAAKGDAFKGQLMKLKRHLPKTLSGKLPWRFGITKCDQMFAGPNEARWMNDAYEHLSTDFLELVENEAADHVLNINSDLIFDPDMTPQDFLKSVLESDEIPSLPTPLATDCLDRDIESFTKQFQELGFLELFEERFKRCDGQTLSEPTLGDEAETKNPFKFADVWESLKARTLAHVVQTEEFAATVKRASEEIRETQRLSIQRVSKPIDDLCNTTQPRLIECFLAAEDAALSAQQRQQTQNFYTIAHVIIDMGSRGWLKKADVEKLKIVVAKTQGELDRIARQQGFRDLDDQIGNSREEATTLNHFCAGAVVGVQAGTGLGATLEVGFGVFPMAGELGALGCCIGVGCVVGFGIFGALMYLKITGDRYSEEIRELLERALQAIQDANAASAAHINTLVKLRLRIQKDKV